MVIIYWVDELLESERARIFVTPFQNVLACRFGGEEGQCGWFAFT